MSRRLVLFVCECCQRCLAGYATSNTFSQELIARQPPYSNEDDAAHLTHIVHVGICNYVSTIPCDILPCMNTSKHVTVFVNYERK